MKLTHWFTRIRRPTNRRCLRRPLACQPLEQRWLMAADAVGDEVLINDLVIRTQTTEASQAAVSASEANHVVVFTGNGPGDSDGVFAKVYDADGEPMGDAFLVNSTVRGVQHAASVASDADGNFVVVWAGRGVGDANGIFFQRYTATGEAIGSETRVNTTTAGTQSDPAVVINDDGSFTIGWSGQSSADSSGVYVQQYDGDGQAVGGEVLVNTTVEHHQTGIALVYDSEDNLVAAWSSLHQDGSDWGIYAQRFDGDGERLGDEFLWNETTANSQTGVTLAAGPDGEVVAAWQTRAQDGDGWGVAARRLGSDGTTLGDEVLLNDVTAGDQFDVHLAITEEGEWLATWTTGQANGAGWEVVARTFESDATADGAAIAVNQDTAGANSGHQQYPSVATARDRAWVVWSGRGANDRRGVYLQAYEVETIDDGPQQAPNLAAIDDTTASVGMELDVTVTATDPNSNDSLTFLLDADNSPEGATLEQTGDSTAVIRWTPGAADEGETFTFRVLVVDDGDPALSDSEEFTVVVGNTPLTLDLSGPEVPGNNLSAVFAPGGGAVSIVDQSLSITGANDGMIQNAVVVLSATPDGTAESLAVDVLDTNITASYDPASRVLQLLGVDTAANYERVLRTLSYNNTSGDASGTRSVTLAVVDSQENSNVATIDLAIGSIDLVALAQAIADSGATFYGAAWCPVCTAQKELFEDGAQLLPFEEVTNPDRSLNELGMQHNIQVFPTWVFEDGTRLEGLQSLQTLAAAAGVDLPVSETPFLAEIPDDTLLVGSPLHIPLDGYDPNGEPLSYTVTTNNPDVTAELLTGNRSMRVDVAGFGDLVFELFEQRAPRATERVIDLAMEDFYDGVKFHRVVNNFVIQGGDPLGNGTGGSDKGDFDDQFHVDLQHNRTGLLSFAKSADDTNDSQFFITEGDSSSLRNLDFNHTIFGILVEGESNRDAISNTAVARQMPSNPLSEVSRPTNDVVMENVEIFTDTENATLLLKAAEGASGPVEVTVTVTNQAGNSFERTFVVDVEDDLDTVESGTNGRPFLGDIAPVSIEQNTTAEIQLTSTDVEGDPVVYDAIRRGMVDYTFELSDEGLLTVTPPADFTGTMEIEVRVRREQPTNANDFDSQLITIEVEEAVADA